MRYIDMDTTELQALKADLETRYAEFKARDLKLNMARGKPSPAQLALSLPILDVINSESDLMDDDGDDMRNYGLFDGVPEAKALMGEMLGVPAENVIMTGNSSLNTMYDMIARSYTHGVLGNTPWCKQDELIWLCPAPGYDRHFGIVQHFGFKLVTIPMTPDGPDMDQVEEWVNNNPAVKGIWCVPKYSNPQGYTYSDETVRRFAALKPAAPDFRIYWDNAYAVHDLDDEGDELLNIMEACEEAGNPDIWYTFGSFSKISFAGSGIAGFAASAVNVDDVKRQLSVQTIGHDKINQLRHARYFKDLDGVKAHMAKHAAIVKPKFDLLLEGLERELDGLGVGEWSKPKGGYFVSFQTLPGCAKAVVAAAKEAGVTMTGAGAPYPYKQDPDDSNIRIAPTYPSLEELGLALELFVLCVKLVSVRKILSER